jgi:tRNA 2-thiocytidine biosynthesis protein TtcA
MGRALHRYDMIGDGDRIAVGLSGGKDSLTLLWMLNERRKRVPIRYEVEAIHVDPGFAGGFAGPLQDYSRQMGFRLTVEMSDCGTLAHSPANRENPCFLCARIRRKQLFEAADALGCNKLALGHNKDDVIETLFLNICYAGEISTMVPRQTFFKGRFTVIRPLALADAQMIRRFAKQEGLPDFSNPCPTAQVSKRREIKLLLDQLYRSNKKIKGNILRAMQNVRSDYLL